MKKKVLALTMAGVMAGAVCSASAARKITVLVGGEEIQADVKPTIINDRTMLPLRAVFEALDVKVSFDDATKTVKAEKDDTVVEITIGNDKMKVNGEEVLLDSPAVIVNDRTLVPVRACAESFDLDVEWNDVTKTVRVKKDVSVVSEEIDANGNITKYTYDENGNEIKMEYSHGWLEQKYDENQNIISVETSEGKFAYFYYNENGLHVKTDNYRVGEITYTYDEDGNMTEMKQPHFWMKFEYDENGNCIKEIHSEGGITTYTYNERGQLLSSEDSYGLWIKNTYDDNGNLIIAEASQGIGCIDTYTYDENNNLIYEENELGENTKYTYDENGKLVLQESLWGNDEYPYDEDGKYTEFISYWEKYEYDENGHLIKTEDSEGLIKNYIVVKR